MAGVGGALVVQAAWIGSSARGGGGGRSRPAEAIEQDCSADSRATCTSESPIGLGRCGVRQPKMPAGAPPSRGGFAFDLTTSSPRLLWNTNSSQTWEKASRPAVVCAGWLPHVTCSRERAARARPGCRGVPFLRDEGMGRPTSARLREMRLRACTRSTTRCTQSVPC